MVGVLLKLHGIWYGEMTQENQSLLPSTLVEQLAAALTLAPGSSGLQGHLHTYAHSQSEISEYTYLS